MEDVIKRVGSPRCANSSAGETSLLPDWELESLFQKLRRTDYRYLLNIQTREMDQFTGARALRIKCEWLLQSNVFGLLSSQTWFLWPNFSRRCGVVATGHHERTSQ